MNELKTMLKELDKLQGYGSSKDKATSDKRTIIVAYDPSEKGEVSVACENGRKFNGPKDAYALVYALAQVLADDVFDGLIAKNEVLEELCEMMVLYMIKKLEKLMKLEGSDND